MRVLVCEFITGGGLRGALLPPSLAREGELMLQALLADLATCGVDEITVLRDARLAPIEQPKIRTQFVVGDFMDTYARCCDRADAVLPIAPETGGALLQLSRIAVERQCYLLASRAEAVALAGSKLMTCAHLESSGLRVVPTRRLDGFEYSTGSWVLKPEDGAGGEHCVLIESMADWRAWRDRHGAGQGYVLQPYLCGTDASLLLLCRAGECALLAGNRQYLTLDAAGCRLTALGVNALPARTRTSLEPLARAIVRAIPGLWGFAGVDLLLIGDGVVVVEINPRITTAYAGLGVSLGTNPAAWLLNLAQGGGLPEIDHSRARAVRVNLV
jgi:predicted ATP-grasp superfamily ATP-dependent carboligase